MSQTKLTSRMPAALLLLSVLLVSVDAHGQKKQPGISEREIERRNLAINLVRAINSAESNYKKNHGVYATWETLLGAGDFTDTGTKWATESAPAVAHATYGRGPEIVPGWKLRLNLSKEGSTYDLLLEDVMDPKCGYAVFSDERSVVRQGTSVACEP